MAAPTYLKSTRIQEFLNFCLEKARVFRRPMTKGTLSKEYVALYKLPIIPYYFSVCCSDDRLAKSIQESNHSLEDQAKLMCLLSLPVDGDFFKVLNAFAIIELDGFQRITSYEYGATSFACVHKAPRITKQRKMREKQEKAERGGGEGNDEEEDDDDVMVNEDEDSDGFEILEESSTFKTPTQPTSKSNNRPSDSPLQALLNSVSSTSGPWTNPSQPSSSTPYLPPSNYSQYGNRQQTPSKHQYQEMMGIKNGRPHSSQGSVSGSQGANESTPMSTTKEYNPERPALEAVLQKLEYFFLYKCCPDLMPLCVRIKEVKESVAKYSQKNIQQPTIKSFFEVSLRLMVSRNANNNEPVKMEHGLQIEKVAVQAFLDELRTNDIVEGLDEVIFSIQNEVTSQEMISYHSIVYAFTELVTNLAQIS